MKKIYQQFGLFFVMGHQWPTRGTNNPKEQSCTQCSITLSEQFFICLRGDDDDAAEDSFVH